MNKTALDSACHVSPFLIKKASKQDFKGNVFEDALVYIHNE